MPNIQIKYTAINGKKVEPTRALGPKDKEGKQPELQNLYEIAFMPRDGKQAQIPPEGTAILQTSIAIGVPSGEVVHVGVIHSEDRLQVLTDVVAIVGPVEDRFEELAICLVNRTGSTKRIDPGKKIARMYLASGKPFDLVKATPTP